MKPPRPWPRPCPDCRGFPETLVRVTVERVIDVLLDGDWDTTPIHVPNLPIGRCLVCDVELYFLETDAAVQEAVASYLGRRKAPETAAGPGPG